MVKHDKPANISVQSEGMDNTHSQQRASRSRGRLELKAILRQQKRVAGVTSAWTGPPSVNRVFCMWRILKQLVFMLQESRSRACRYFL